MNPPKPFNKIREHFHVPMLLILINFFVVTTIYYLYQYLQPTGMVTAATNGFFSFGTLFFLFASLYSRSGSLTKFTYMVSTAFSIYFFWG